MELTAIVFLVVIGTSLWVLFDASSRGIEGIGPFGWFLFCIALWIVAFPLYLASRSKMEVQPAEDAKPAGRIVLREDFDRYGNTPTSNDDTKPCPFCAETIKAAAVKCRYCGERLG